MTEKSESAALLPTGLQDVLPPEAAQESETVRAILAAFALRGYEEARPPLVEFERTLVADGAPSDQIFRVMDPVSQRMMGVRADMTLQIARIAATRLSKAARPLRLSYAGPVLRVRGTQLQPERQLTQAGAELIGVDAVAADVEIVLLAAEGLAAAGIGAPTIDLSAPALLAGVTETLDVSPETRARLRYALARKDAAALDALPPADAAMMEALLTAAGPAEEALEALRAIDLPPASRAEAERLADVVAALARAQPALRPTVDPVESRGFEYQTGLSFTIFAQGVRGELGRGGRYETPAGEPATGLTLFLDAILRGVRPPARPARVFVPFGEDAEAGSRLRKVGWSTVGGLAPVPDARVEARRLKCSHVLVGGAPVAVPAETDAAGSKT